MSAAIAIDDATILGAATPPTSQAPFNRAGLVVRGQDGTLLQVRTYTRGGAVEGPAFAEDDWHDLVRAGQALELPQTVPLAPGAALWILRARLPRRERALHDLRASGVMIREHMHGIDDAWLCLVDESHPAAAALRDRWRREAFDAAVGFGRSGQWSHAEVEAQLAHAFARGLEPAVLALLSLAHEHTGRSVRAAGLLKMAFRSRGDEFTRQVREQLERLRSELLVPADTAPARSRGVTWRRQARAMADQANQRALRARFSSAKEAA